MVPVSNDGVLKPPVGWRRCNWTLGREAGGKAGTKILMRWMVAPFKEGGTQDATGLWLGM